MCRYASGFELLHDVVGHLIVDNALSNDCTLLFAVECSCIVLIIYDYNAFLIGCINLLCFSFIHLFFFLQVFHNWFPPFFDSAYFLQGHSFMTEGKTPSIVQK